MSLVVTFISVHPRGHELDPASTSAYRLECVYASNYGGGGSQKPRTYAPGAGGAGTLRDILAGGNQVSARRRWWASFRGVNLPCCREIVRRRRSMEYKLQRRPVRKGDFLRAINVSKNTCEARKKRHCVSSCSMS